MGVTFLRPPVDWTPLALGASLVAWWDAEQASTITQAAGLVSSWKDIVGAYDCVQATGANQPLYSATSFNGRPGVTFDGVSDFLARAGTLPASFPTGANPGEIWVVTDQAALPADTGVRVAVSYGGGSSVMRQVNRIVTAATNRGRYSVNGVVSDNTSVVLSGRHVLRGITSATNSQADIDGVAGPSVAVVPATTTLALVIGASSNSNLLFWSGTHSAILITLALNATQASQLYGFLNRRI